MTYEYTIRYRITGYDHDGYCSGAEADEDGTSINEYKIIKVDKESLVIDIQSFDIYEEGCSSNGSGYCKGFHQYREAVKVLAIKIFNGQELYTNRVHATTDEPEFIYKLRKLFCLMVQFTHKFLYHKLTHPILCNKIFQYCTLPTFLYKNILYLNTQKCCKCGLKKA